MGRSAASQAAEAQQQRLLAWQQPSKRRAAVPLANGPLRIEDLNSRLLRVAKRAAYPQRAHHSLALLTPHHPPPTHATDTPHTLHTTNHPIQPTWARSAAGWAGCRPPCAESSARQPWGRPAACCWRSPRRRQHTQAWAAKRRAPRRTARGCRSAACSAGKGGSTQHFGGRWARAWVTMIELTPAAAIAAVIFPWRDMACGARLALCRMGWGLGCMGRANGGARLPHRRSSSGKASGPPQLAGTVPVRLLPDRSRIMSDWKAPFMPQTAGRGPLSAWPAKLRPSSDLQQGGTSNAVPVTPPRQAAAAHSPLPLPSHIKQMDRTGGGVTTRHHQGWMPCPLHHTTHLMVDSSAASEPTACTAHTPPVLLPPQERSLREAEGRFISGLHGWGLSN